MLKATLSTVINTFALYSGGMEQRIVKQLVKLVPEDALSYGQLTVRIMHSEYQFTAKQSGACADITIKKPIRFLWLLQTQGDLGFANAYINGVFQTRNLRALLTFAFENRDGLSAVVGRREAMGLWQKCKHRLRHNSVKNARKNIAAHYDLGNDFYALWLDETMTYSAALFDGSNDSLEVSQQRKNQRIIDQLGMQSGDTILEIGCGWGGFAEMAAEQGGIVKGLTLSTEQYHYAKYRLAAFNADIAIQDYRHEQYQYDYIVSIEMFEAVGKDYWADYFETLKRSLKAGGKAVLQVITINGDEADVARYQNSVDFIQAYIFPGGLLPSLMQLKHLAKQHGFDVMDTLSFGSDYDTTLVRWEKQFQQHSYALLKAGYDEAFQRMWRYYLVYCQVGFYQQRIDVVQLTLTHS